jgi:hypothetical protein
VITGNTAHESGGGIAVYTTSPTTSDVTIGGTVFAKNVSNTTSYRNFSNYHVSPFKNEGNNVLDNNAGDYFSLTGSDYIDTTTLAGDLVVVTNVGDTISNTDGGISLREAVITANAGNDTVWLPAWQFILRRTGTGAADQGDFDVSGNISIRGVGPGLARIDASGLGKRTTTSDRIFDVNTGATLNLSGVTLAFGQAPMAPITPDVRNGGAILVRNGAVLKLSHSAVVGNRTLGGGDGGAIYFASTASGSIDSSVITANESGNGLTGGVYLQAASGTGGTVTLSRTIIANNNTTSESSRPDFFIGAGRTLASLGHNRLTTSGGGFTPAASDYIGAVHYVVSTISDTWGIY